LVGFKKFKSELDALGVKVVAASVDPIDKAKEVAAELSFPVAYGVTREVADRIGAWWEDRRGIIQPSEFLLTADGKVRSATYSSGPIGRVDAADVIKLIAFYDKLATQKM
jgi:peroxiredoxin